MKSILSLTVQMDHSFHWLVPRPLLHGGTALSCIIPFPRLALSSLLNLTYQALCHVMDQYTSNQVFSKVSTNGNVFNICGALVSCRKVHGIYGTFCMHFKLSQPSATYLKKGYHTLLLKRPAEPNWV